MFGYETRTVRKKLKTFRVPYYLLIGEIQKRYYSSWIYVYFNYEEHKLKESFQHQKMQ